MIKNIKKNMKKKKKKTRDEACFNLVLADVFYEECFLYFILKLAMIKPLLTS